MKSDNKKKALSKMGYKPKYTKKKLPNNMTHAEYNDRKTKYKYTENIKRFDNFDIIQESVELELKNKLKIYKRIISIFLDELPSDEIILKYIEDNSDQGHEMQDFIGMNMKIELDFATASSIMDSIDLIFSEAMSNDNFADYSENDY